MWRRIAWGDCHVHRIEPGGHTVSFPISLVKCLMRNNLRNGCFCLMFWGWGAWWWAQLLAEEAETWGCLLIPGQIQGRKRHANDTQVSFSLFHFHGLWTMGWCFSHLQLPQPPTSNHLLGSGGTCRLAKMCASPRCVLTRSAETSNFPP